MPDFYWGGNPTTNTLKFIFKAASFNTAAAGNVTLWTPAAGKAITLYGYTMSMDAINRALLQGATFGSFASIAGLAASISMDFYLYPQAIFAVNEIIRINVGAATATNWGVTMWGTEN